MTVGVKICGIMTPHHARAAVQARADYLGLVFAPSRRRVDIATAQAIVTAARAEAAAQHITIAVVGVFVNEPPAVTDEIAQTVGLDFVQLSGHESASHARMTHTPLIKAIRFDAHPSEVEWLEQTHSPTPLLIDAHVAGSFGGAGVTGDWQRAAALARQRPVWLAGGLTPDNVAEAVERVQPLVVDVSSGVESDGVKDIAKMDAFVRAAKQASILSDTAVDR